MGTSKDTQKRAVVLLSGGLDSATVAACLLRDGYHVTALSIDYGQRHAVELKAAATIAHEVGVNEHRVMKLDLRAFGGSALTDETIEVPKADAVDEDVSTDIPITYVPARNTIFLSLALGLAEAVGADQIGIGVNALDYSGYPDCRPEFVNKFGELADLATREGVEGRPINLYTPLLDLTKVEILKLAYQLNVPVDKTISCYDPDEHGTPCELCDSCRLRNQALQQLCKS
ncbi:MAG TPA: 7-cyano-7-deazaguanine synthase QueC [Planctomycetes bacterium]|jgi:7-cyano-7-deazaguanine synthase|nr:7-cyano-7-deazaguanine synthase QueC [Planctomycetota bacterium]